MLLPNSFGEEVKVGNRQRLVQAVRNNGQCHPRCGSHTRRSIIEANAVLRGKDGLRLLVVAVGYLKDVEKHRCRGVRCHALAGLGLWLSTDAHKACGCDVHGYHGRSSDHPRVAAAQGRDKR